MTWIINKDWQKLKDATTIREITSRNYVGNFFNDPSTIKSDKVIDCIDKKFETFIVYLMIKTFESE